MVTIDSPPLEAKALMGISDIALPHIGAHPTFFAAFTRTCDRALELAAQDLSRPTPKAPASTSLQLGFKKLRLSPGEESVSLGVRAFNDLIDEIHITQLR